MTNSIRDRLPPEIAQDYEARLAGYLSEAPEGGVAGFLSRLHDEGKIDTSLLCEILGTVEVELTRPTAGAAETAPIGVLGRGSMGEVLLARDAQLNRHVALKRILSDCREDPEGLRRFQQEVQIMAQLAHPGIAPVYGIEAGPDGVSGYAMKLVQGKTLADYLAETRAQHERGEPDEDHALAARLDVFLQLCNAVHYAHTRGVIHRDLKPANVMIGAFGEVMLMDWGVARLIGRGAEQTGGAGIAAYEDGTMAGTAIGTPAYMSPEQARGGTVELDGKSDQYALGLILQEIVSLKRALTGKGLEHVYWRAQEGERDPFVHAVPGQSVPRELAGIVARATQPDPARRYADVDALADDVRRFLRDESVLAAPDGPLHRITRFIGRHRTAALGAILALVVLALGGVGVTIGGAAVVIEALQYRAAQREAALQRVTTAVAAQARAIDTRFLRYESLLTGFAFATSHALRTVPPEGARIVEAADPYAEPTAVPSAVYHLPISVDVPTIWRSPTTDDASWAFSAPRLAGLDREMLRVLLLSGGDEVERLSRAEYTALVADRGLPIVWVYAGLEDGTIATLPGSGGYPKDYDPREQPWYAHGRGRRTVDWDPATLDESDTEDIGLLISAGTGLWDGDRFLGTAGLDVSVHYVVDELLAMPDLGVPVDTWLIDEQGRTIVTSTVLTGTPPFPFAEEMAAKGGFSGVVEVEDAGDPKLVAWSRVQSLDWTYAIVGPAEALLAAVPAPDGGG